MSASHLLCVFCRYAPCKCVREEPEARTPTEQFFRDSRNRWREEAERYKEHAHALTTRVQACENVLVILQRRGHLDPEHLRAAWAEAAPAPQCKHGIRRGEDCGLCDLGNGFETAPAPKHVHPCPLDEESYFHNPDAKCACPRTREERFRARLAEAAGRILDLPVPDGRDGDSWRAALHSAAYELARTRAPE